MILERYLTPTQPRLQDLNRTQIVGADSFCTNAKPRTELQEYHVNVPDVWAEDRTV